jgi:predicted regulator of Ras-like GTPase activity (Roadblock/LC7/MglB family)
MALLLDKECIKSMRKVAQNLIGQSESDGCVLCDGGGHMLVQEGVGTKDPLLLAALGAGVFAGSRELAQMLGEENFSVVLHQGEHKSIFIRSVDEEILLVVIFSKPDSAGLVRLYAGPAAERLKGLLEQARRSGTEISDPERSFVLKDGADIFARG